MGRQNLPQRDLRVLWDLGTAAGQSDAELLGRFVKGPAGVSDLAFRAILARHGPMVLGACRRLLADGHDVEDAFQATFLVLVRRADSLRVTDTLGPWLHEVARRVALEARAIALRRRLREDQSTDLAAVPAHGSSVDVDDTRAVIDEEVCRLTPNMRAAVVLCDLEGMTIEGAAHQLGWPSGTMRSRLARGRERLRSRLARRGFGPASAALVGVPPAVVEALAASTSRLAVLSLSGIKTAGAVPASVLTLMQGVLTMLFWNRAKTTAGMILAFIALAAGIASAMRAEEPVRNSPVPRPTRDRTEQPATYKVAGVVRVEGTGEPVPGARLQVFDERIKPETSSTTSGPDGRYQVTLAPGEWQGVNLRPPAGYWVADVSSSAASFVLSREAPECQRDFVVRRGTIWDFQASDAIGSSDGSHVVVGATDALEPEFTTEPAELNSRRFGLYPSETDEKGQARLTLPSEGKRLKLSVTLRSSDDQGPALLTKPVFGLLEWTTDFQPASLSRIEKTGQGYHLVDRAGRTADLRCGEEIELKESNGKPRIVLRLRKADRPQSRKLTGRVVDLGGNPIEGAKVTLQQHFDSARTNVGSVSAYRLTGSIRTNDGVVTDQDGRFLISRTSFTTRDEEVSKFSVSVKKQGYATATSPEFVFRPGDNGEPHVVVEPVRLEPGVSLGGTAVDPSGKAVVGARVWGWCNPEVAHVESTRTDDAGRFLIHGLAKGAVTLKCVYGELHATGTFTVDGKGEDVRLQLRPVTRPAASPR